MAEFVIALAGNPNTGKSTIFNALTGSRQHVGNWPGKTVEKKEGRWQLHGHGYRLVDLPGAYSLSAYSSEELITREFIVEAQPHLVVVVVDATNLERNLYLAVQILEMQVPVLLVLNMHDQARAKGLAIDTGRLAAALGAPVIASAARNGEGLQELKEMIARLTAERPEQRELAAWP